jgi:simple sugar transport system permease protein
MGVLRAKRNAHEVITSIMFNFIVAGITLLIGNRLLFHGGTTRGGAVVEGARLPDLHMSGSSANWSIAIAVLVVAMLAWLRSRTTWGQAWRAVGRDPAAARSVGISIEKTQIVVMTLSGALAGLSAANFVMGHKHAFEEGLGRGTGFIAIAVALLARQNPIAVVFAALALGFLSVGGLAVGNQIPKELPEMLQGVVVLAIATSSVWVRRHEGRERKAKA